MHPQADDYPIEQEVLDFLNGIDSGSVVLYASKEPQFVFSGTVAYKASNGWEIEIFNDANEWDYIERITTPNGISLSYSDIQTHFPIVAKYRPTELIAWKRYRIPGECQFRCPTCDEIFDRTDLLYQHMAHCNFP